jgi:predicted O-methyltransferase YrrM
MNTVFPDNIEEALRAAFTDTHIASNTIQQHEWEMRTFLRLVLDELKPERTVELGTYKGWTTVLLSLATSRYTVSVDIEDHGMKEACKWAGFLETVLTDATTPDCVNHVITRLGGPVDLLFIDDGHYYEQIVREFELWRPHVRPGGWIVFHDINPLANIGPHGVQPDCVQVTRFWQELQGNKQEIIATEEHRAWKGIVPNGGLGILRT